MELSFNDNFDRAFQGTFRSEAWKREVYATLHRRFRDIRTARSLILLARNGYEISDWKYFLHFYVAIHETLYRLFLETWLYPESPSRTVCGSAQQTRFKMSLTVWKSHNPEKNGSFSFWSDSDRQGDLIRMASDFGLLDGEEPTKTFSTLQFPDEVYSQLLPASLQLRKIPLHAECFASDLWKLILLSQDQVHAHLLRSDQYRKLDYHFAGSIVELTLLPCASAYE